MPENPVTTGRAYPIPHEDNKLREDEDRLGLAFQAIDNDVTALFAAMAGKAPTSHEHSINQVAGLASALAGLASQDHQHALQSLTDVDVTDAVNTMVLMKVGSLWTPVLLQIGHIASLEAALAGKAPNSAIATLADAVAARMAAANYPGLVSLEGVSMGQCRLDKVNATTLRLSRHDGKKLFINGAFRDIPVGGVSYVHPGAGFPVSVTFNIYAYMNGATMTLEHSSTPSAVDATYGHKIKTGDSTRTLVGMAWSANVGQFGTDETQTLSYFNRRRLIASASLLAAPVTAVPPLNTPLAQQTFLSWADGVGLMAHGQAAISGGQHGAIMQYVDGNNVLNAYVYANTPTYENYHLHIDLPLGEGVHVYDVVGIIATGGQTLTPVNGSSQVTVMG